MFCEEWEQNTSQVHMLSLFRDKTWKWGRPVHWLKKKKKTRRGIHYLDTGIRPKRYKESARKQGRADLDTNRGAVGQKTGRGELPTQGRGQRGYTHHAW